MMEHRIIRQGMWRCFLTTLFFTAGVGEGQAVYLDFKDAIKRYGEDKISERYGNLFQMYDKITGENPYKIK